MQLVNFHRPGQTIDTVFKREDWTGMCCNEYGCEQLSKEISIEYMGLKPA